MRRVVDVDLRQLPPVLSVHSLRGARPCPGSYRRLERVSLDEPIELFTSEVGRPSVSDVLDPALTVCASEDRLACVEVSRRLRDVEELVLGQICSFPPLDRGIGMRGATAAIERL